MSIQSLKINFGIEEFTEDRSCVSISSIFFFGLVLILNLHNQVTIALRCRAGDSVVRISRFIVLSSISNILRSIVAISDNISAASAACCYALIN